MIEKCTRCRLGCYEPDEDGYCCVCRELHKDEEGPWCNACRTTDLAVPAKTGNEPSDA
jgi:hypothetical protein